MNNSGFHPTLENFQKAIELLPMAVLVRTSTGFACLNKTLSNWAELSLKLADGSITMLNLMESFELDHQTQIKLKNFLKQDTASLDEPELKTQLTTGQTFRWQWLSNKNNDYLIIENISAWQNQINELQALSDTDPLTGLANRRRFQRDFARLIAQGKRIDQTGALILFDIDNLKAINDKWGHTTADKLLSQFGSLAKPCIRPYESLARVGGDEFAIVTQHSGLLGAKRIIHAMETVFNQLVLPDNQPLSASFGVALLNASVETSPLLDINAVIQIQIDHIYSMADIELYKAKRLKKNLS